jgi:hypothetical protein
MTNAFTEALTVIDNAGSPGSGFGRIPSELNKNLDDRYIYLRFKPGGGQPLTHVRVEVSKNVK